jgi:hypothetical protein
LQRALFLNFQQTSGLQLRLPVRPARMRALVRRRVVSTQRFAVEFDRRVVGIAVRVPGGFMFFASDDDFEQLDGELFPRARAIARRLEKVSKRKGVTMRAPGQAFALAAS